MNAIVVLDALTHPHAEMYLETLEALDEVSGIVLVHPDAAARSAMASQTGKLRAAYAELQPALEQPGVTHAPRNAAESLSG